MCLGPRRSSCGRLCSSSWSNTPSLSCLRMTTVKVSLPQRHRNLGSSHSGFGSPPALELDAGLTCLPGGCQEVVQRSLCDTAAVNGQCLVSCRWHFRPVLHHLPIRQDRDASEPVPSLRLCSSAVQRQLHDQAPVFWHDSRPEAEQSTLCRSKPRPQDHSCILLHCFLIVLCTA